MKSMNEQFAEMQKKTMENLEPVQNMNSVAAQAFERIARKNYDLMGDLVDYAVAQVKVPESDADMKDVYEQRVAETQAFAEKVNARAAEYVELASELGEMVTNGSAPAAAPSVKTKAKPKSAAAKKPAAKKTASKKRTAKAK